MSALEICSAFKWLDGSGYCGEPADAISVVGCVHEHLGRRGICYDCAATMQRMVGPEPLICVPCDEGPAAHECPVFARIEWNDGTVTVVQEMPQPARGASR